MSPPAALGAAAHGGEHHGPNLRAMFSNFSSNPLRADYFNSDAINRDTCAVSVGLPPLVKGTYTRHKIQTVTLETIEALHVF